MTHWNAKRPSWPRRTRGHHVDEGYVSPAQPVSSFSLGQAAEVVIAGWAERRTKRQLVDRLMVCVDVIGRDIDLRNVRTRQLDKVVAHLIGMGRSGPTINRYLSGMSVVLTWAYDNEHINRIPTIPWKAESNYNWVGIGPEMERQISERFIAHGKPVYALLVRVLTTTGLRVNELLSLKASQIADGWITLRMHSRARGNFEVPIPIADDLGQQLLAAIKSKQGLPSYFQLKTSFRRVREELGLRDEITLHTLRHTAGTRMAERDVSLVVMQKFLRHRNPEMTMRYRKSQDPKLIEASQALSRSRREPKKAE